MNGWSKQKLRRLRKLKIKNWHLVVALIIALSSSVYFLRSNNLKMVELRNAVLAADESDDGVSEALENLNYHVFHHMNTEIVRPVELVETYNREAKAAIEAINKDDGRDIYAEATKACERRGIPITSIAQCAADYALSNNPAGEEEKIELPNKDLFTYSFASPLWTPDAAGFSILITGVVLIWLILRITERIIVVLVVRKRTRSGF